MDTRQLNYILTIAECGSISKAADKLFISQSGLNQQLQRIEKELGISCLNGIHIISLSRKPEPSSCAMPGKP